MKYAGDVTGTHNIYGLTEDGRREGEREMEIEIESKNILSNNVYPNRYLYLSNRLSYWNMLNL